MKGIRLGSLLMGLFGCLVAIGGSAQTIQRNIPDASVDQARLARIDTLIRGYIDKGQVNGVVTLVIHDGHVVQYKAYGYSDREAHKAMRPDDLFRIASQTKDRLTVIYTEDSLHRVVRWTKEKTVIDPNYPLMHKRYFSGGAGGEE